VLKSYNKQFTSINFDDLQWKGAPNEHTGSTATFSLVENSIICFIEENITFSLVENSIMCFIEENITFSLVEDLLMCLIIHNLNLVWWTDSIMCLLNGTV